MNSFGIWLKYCVSFISNEAAEIVFRLQLCSVETNELIIHPYNASCFVFIFFLNRKPYTELNRELHLKKGNITNLIFINKS